MSGGHWDYRNDSVCEDIFGLYPNYGDRGFKFSSAARRSNPLVDPEISELVYDVFCLLHSADWYFSADTGEDTYRADIKYFKEKWLKTSPESRVKREIESELSQIKKRLETIFDITLPDNFNTETR